MGAPDLGWRAAVDPQPGRRTLVTGGAGFIGGHLVARLAGLGHRVVVLDDVSTGRWSNVDGVPGVECVEGSVLDTALVHELTGRSDEVYHLAAAVGVSTILDDPLRSLRTNLHGTEAVLDAALAHGVRVLVASTSEIYGMNTADSLDEDAHRVIGSPLVARWSYAEAKAVDETLAHAYWRHHGLSTVIVRPFNVVGPGQTGRYGMVVPRLVGQAVRGEPLTVYGDGSQTRCFCHVREAVEGLVALMALPEADGRVFNLGRSDEVSIARLAERVIELSGSASDIRRVPYDQAYGEGFEDMRRRMPDITRVREAIGFEPRLGLDDIIAEVLASVRSAEKVAI